MEKIKSFFRNIFKQIKVLLAKSSLMELLSRKKKAEGDK